MSQFTLRGYRRWWILAAILIVLGIAAVPAAGIVHHMVDDAVGRTTVATDDGTERTVYWREYPGVAGIATQQVLDGPTPQQGYDAGQTMIAEIKAALSEELRLEWAPVGDTGGSRPFHRPIANHYGGKSLLTNVNGPEAQSTTVPQTWEENQRAISIIGEVTHRYGYEAPTIDGLEGWSAEDRIRDLGGPPPRQLFGALNGDAPTRQ